ncbi:MAG: hypothetical protein LBU90_07005 [Bacteroidales bacterium]|jgi:hypothetical protein|nr:hypothetical protein [Bacteroidales bacterium]
MPYRRLPNTDAARTRAISKAINITLGMHPSDIAFDYKTLTRAKFFLPTFKTSIRNHRENSEHYVEKNGELTHLQKQIRMYITHFLQVLSMSIQRGEIPVDAWRYYDVEKNGKKFPKLKTDEDLLLWGKKLIDGEEQRVQDGGTPMSNPRISVLSVIYNKYAIKLKSTQFNHDTKENGSEYIQKLRDEADELILEIWNNVEHTFAHLPADEKRQKAEEYGLCYVFRPYEREAQTSAPQE